jgi:hypothetical protein
MERIHNIARSRQRFSANFTLNILGKILLPYFALFLKTTRKTVDKVAALDLMQNTGCRRGTRRQNYPHGDEEEDGGQDGRFGSHINQWEYGEQDGRFGPHQDSWKDGRQEGGLGPHKYHWENGRQA